MRGPKLHDMTWGSSGDAGHAVEQRDTGAAAIVEALKVWLQAKEAAGVPELGFYAAPDMPAHRDLQQHFDELEEYVAALAELHPRDITVEVGLYRGGTHFAWLQLFHEVISIDRNYWTCCKAVVEFPQPRSRFLYGDSQVSETVAVLEEMLDGRVVDHLFIDGHHDRDFVRNDFLNYAPLVRSGGIIGFHDVHWRGGSVGAFLNELSHGMLEGWRPPKIHDINYHRRDAMGIAYFVKH
jgi:hypothetical protein